jgi:hypothetical protein
LGDPEARGFTVISAAAFVSGAAATVCSAMLGAFFEALFDCMKLILDHMGSGHAAADRRSLMKSVD